MHTTQKMKFSVKDFFSKYGQIRWKMQIWSHVLKKFLMESFIFCAVTTLQWIKFNFDSRNISNASMHRAIKERRLVKNLAKHLGWSFLLK